MMTLRGEANRLNPKLQYMWSALEEASHPVSPPMVPLAQQPRRAKAGRLRTLRPPVLESRSRELGCSKRDVELSGSLRGGKPALRPHFTHMAGGQADFAAKEQSRNAITGPISC